MIDPTDREYLTPEQMEAVKAASRTRAKLSEQIVDERYQAALDYLDDGKWTVAFKYVWRRSYDGNKLTYIVDKDRYNLTKPFSSQADGYWGTNAFEFLFTIFHETLDGFGENELDKLQRTPRKGAERHSPQSTLYLNKLKPELLPAREKKWNENQVPPKEVLEQMVKWDDYLKLLVKISPERDTTEYVFDQNFVELNGEMYAIWRVRSMLEFGNQDGHISRERWKQLLNDHPEIKKPLISEPVIPEFKYKSRFNRRKLLANALSAKPPQEDDPRERKRREDEIHDARVVAAQAQKAVFANSKRIRRKKSNE